MNNFTLIILFLISISSFTKKITPFECGHQLYIEKNGCKKEEDACRKLCISNDK